MIKALCTSTGYVTPNRTIALGRLLSILELAGDKTVAPQQHVALWIGEFPCDEHGQPLEKLRCGGAQDLGGGLTADHQFSKKPVGGYADYHQKMETYAAIISAPARKIDPAATARTRQVIESADPQSPFVYPLPAPIGYCDEGGGKPKSIDPIAGPLVRKAFELYVSGEFPIHTLVKEMMRQGLRNRYGAPMSVTGMWKMLRNPFYIGIIHIRRTSQSYQGVHPPLLTKALFERAQATLSGRNYVAMTRHTFLFSRFIKCATCERSLIGERQKGHAYYRCHSESCRGGGLREDDVLRTTQAFLSFMALDDGELGDLRDLQLAADKNAVEDRRNAHAEARRSLGRCDDLLSRLTDAFLDGAVDRELFDARKAKLLVERRGYQDVLEAPPGETMEAATLKKLELANVAVLQAESPNRAEFREAASCVLSNLVADGKNIEFAPVFPFDQRATKLCALNGAPYQAQPRTEGTLIVRAR